MKRKWSFLLLPLLLLLIIFAPTGNIFAHANQTYTIIGKPLGLNYLSLAPTSSNGVPYFYSSNNLLHMAEGSNDGYTLAIRATTIDTEHMPMSYTLFDYFLSVCHDAYCTSVTNYSSYTGGGATQGFLTEGYSGTPGNYWYYITFQTPTSDFYFQSLYLDSQDGLLAFDGSLGFELSTPLTAALYRGTVAFQETDYEPYLGADDTSKPLIDGYEGVYVTDVDNPISIAEFKTLLRAIDDVDGDISDSIEVVSDAYSANSSTLGIYDVVFRAEDQAGNEAIITIKFQVVDSVAPIISGPTTLSSFTSAPRSLSSIQAELSANDNYDGNVTSNIELIKDLYSNYKSKVGTYLLRYRIIDSSGNMSTYDLNVQVIDDTAPIISGAQEYTKGTTVSLNKEQILRGIKAFDNTDGDISSSIVLQSDTYTGNANRIGIYTLTYSVSDSAGNNSSPFVVTVQVIDNIPPVFWISAEIINVDEFTTLSHEDIIALLVTNGTIDSNEKSNITIIIDEYSGNETVLGEHRISIALETANENPRTIHLTLNVIEAEMNDTIEEMPLLWYEHIFHFFTYLGSKIGAFFSWIWFALIVPILSFVGLY